MAKPFSSRTEDVQEAIIVLQLNQLLSKQDIIRLGLGKYLVGSQSNAPKSHREIVVNTIKNT